MGITRVRDAEWLERTFDEMDVPVAVAQTFARGGRNFQRTHDEEAERQTAEIWRRERGPARRRSERQRPGDERGLTGRLDDHAHPKCPARAEQPPRGEVSRTWMTAVRPAAIVTVRVVMSFFAPVGRGMTDTVSAAARPGSGGTTRDQSDGPYRPGRGSGR